MKIFIELQKTNRTYRRLKQVLQTHVMWLLRNFNVYDTFL